jgi:hypothetical protein
MKVLCVFCLLVTSIACTATGSTQKVRMPDQAAAVENAGKGRIYLLRDDQEYGRAGRLLVTQNETPIGELARGDYLCWESNPGLVPLYVVYDRAGMAGGDLRTVTSVRVEAGGTYYVLASFDADKGAAKLRAEILPESDGRARLAGLQPAATE